MFAQRRPVHAFTNGKPRAIHLRDLGTPDVVPHIRVRIDDLHLGAVTGQSVAHAHIVDAVGGRTQQAIRRQDDDAEVRIAHVWQESDVEYPHPPRD